MGLPIDSSLDFLEPQTSVPAVPAAGAKLYVYSDNHVYVREVGSANQAKVWTDTARGPLVLSDTIANSGTVPTLANVGVNNFVTNDLVVRESDGEVFQYNGTSLSDTGKKWGAPAEPIGWVDLNHVTLSGSAFHGSAAAHAHVANGMSAVNDPTMGWCLKVPTAGTYRVTYAARVDDNGPGSWGYSEAYVSVNGGTSASLNGYSIQNAYGTGGPVYGMHHIDEILALNANDKVGIWITAGGMPGGATFQGVDSGLACQLSLTGLPITPTEVF